MKTRLLSLLFFSGLLCCALRLHAQKNFSVFNYTSRNGLPQNSVKSLILDDNGFLWMTTEGGLVRFDGINFKVFNKNNTPFLRTDRLTAILKTVTGDLIAYDGFGGAYQIHDNEVKFMNLKRHSFKKVMGSFPNSNLFSYFSESKLESHKKWFWSDLSEVILPLNFHRFAAATRQSLIFYNDTVETGRLQTASFKGVQYFMMDSNIYFTDKSNNIFRIETIENKIIACRFTKKFPELPFSIIWDYGRNGTFIRSGKFLYLIKVTDDKNVLAFELLHDEMPENCGINNVCYDTINKIMFIGTDTKGLFVYKEKQFKTLSYSQTGGKGNNAYYTQIALDSNTVLTYNQRLFKTTGGYKSNFPYKFNVEGVIVDKQNCLWFSNQNTINKYNLDDHACTVIKESKSKHAYCFYEEIDTMWIGTTYEINYVINGTLFTACKLTESRTSLAPYSIIRGSDHKIWFANNTGLFRLDTKTFTFDTVPELNSLCVRNITYYHGYVFAGTYGNGYYLIKNDKVVHMPLDANHNMAQVHSFVFDNSGFVWLSTNQGLFKTKLSDIENYFKQQNDSIYYMYYGEDNGIFNTEFNGGCSPSNLILKNGTVSLPTMDGLVWFKPDSIKDAKATSAIFFDKIYVDNKEGDTTSLKKIPADVQSIAFDFVTSYWGNSNNLLIEYKLEGFNKQWIPLNPEQTHIEFNNLHSGKYKLAIRKRGGFGENNLIEKQIEIYITPKYYQKTWFILLCLIGATLFVIAIARLYAYRIKQQNKTLEKKVQQRTFELGNANEQLKQSVDVKDKLISIISHDVVTPLRFIAMVARKGSDTATDFDKENMRIALDDIKNTSEKLHYNAQNILNWIKHQNKRINVNNTHVAIGALADDVAEMLKEFTDAKGTTIINHVSLDDIILTDKNILSIIIHNLLTNAIKFTDKGTITIDAKHSQKMYFLIVTDTGRGMKEAQLKRIQKIINEKTSIAPDPAGDATGNGLGYVIISELIQLLKGKVMIESREGHGTCVTLMLAI